MAVSERPMNKATRSILRGDLMNLYIAFGFNYE
jgi:hypothetical protein